MKTKEFLYKVGTVLAYDNMIIKIQECRGCSWNGGSSNTYLCQALVPGSSEVQEAELDTEAVNESADLRLHEDWEKALHGQHIIKIGTILAYDGKLMKVQGWGPSVYHCLVIAPDKQNVQDVWYQTRELNELAETRLQEHWDKAVHYQELMRAAISAYRTALEGVTGAAAE